MSPDRLQWAVVKDENGKKQWKKIRTSPEPETKKIKIQASPLQQKAKLW